MRQTDDEPSSEDTRLTELASIFAAAILRLRHRIVWSLCGSLTQLNDEAYRLFVENQLAVMPSANGVLTKLYYDEVTGKLKRNSKTKKRGSIRRLATFLTRFSRTLDLDVIPIERLIDALPSEFNRWRTPARFDAANLGTQ